MLQPKKIAKSAVFMMIFAFVIKILGFVRDALIAAKYGAGMETDTFFIALTATTLFTYMFSKAINTTMIPVLNEINSTNEHRLKVKYTNNLLNIVLLVSLMIIFLGSIFAPYIIRVLAFGFEGDQFDLAVLLLRIGLPVIFFAGIVGVFRGYLQSEYKFTETAISQLPNNLVYLIFLIFLSSFFGIEGLMVASVLAVASQIFLQIPGIRNSGYKYNFYVNFKDRYIKKTYYLVLPVIFSVAVDNLNKIIDKSLASTLVEGSISALNYSNRLKSLLLEVFITTIITIFFPMLSKEASKENLDGFRGLVTYGTNVILLITIPATIGIVVLSGPIVRVAFERGSFDSVATIMTSSALVFYSLGLVGMALRSFLYRIYYSLQDTKTPMINAFIAVAINIILNFILINFMEHNGLALATSISASITAIILISGLKKKIGFLETKKILFCGTKSLIASLIMGAIVYYLYSFLINLNISGSVFEISILLSSILIGSVVYLIIIFILRVEEISWIYKQVKKKFSKN